MSLWGILALPTVQQNRLVPRNTIVYLGMFGVLSGLSTVCYYGSRWLFNKYRLLKHKNEITSEIQQDDDDDPDQPSIIHGSIDVNL